MSKQSKPLLVYDGDCGFCRRWVARWKVQTQGKVAFVTSQEYAPAHREIKPEEFAGSVQLMKEGRRYAGAEAVFRTLAHAPGQDFWLKAYRALPPFAWAAELFYRNVAAHRQFYSRLTGPDAPHGTYRLARWVFLRGLAISYLAAFASFWTQASGLVGGNGIMPFDHFLKMVHERFGAQATHLVPTLLWLSPTDHALSLVCGAGTALSALLLLDLAPGPLLLLVWALYLSVVEVGGDFMSFQWDMLLLETGFIAIFFAPWRIVPRGIDKEPPKAALWLLRFLLFRLMFESGCVKLLSQDATWRDLTALYYHYETQPLPTWIGWLAHQLPRAIQRFSAGAMFAIELGAPWTIFLPRPGRMFGAAAISFLMVLIALTGNYCFFNLLTLSLCATLLDDAFWGRFLPGRLAREAKADPRPWPKAVSWLAASPLFLAGILQVVGLFWGRMSVPSVVASGFETIESLRLVNSYGLFAVMTRPRYEIAIEGSADGAIWYEYKFKWKPGALDRRPGFIEPLQPRLDWQMWFAALGSYDTNRWFVNLLVRLMQGRPEVLALLEHSPFPAGDPPRYVRAGLYEYHFTTWSERRATGNWWKRQYVRPYCPVLHR